jgi:rubrerythrin
MGGITGTVLRRERRMNKDTIYRQDALDALGDKPETWNDTDYELGQVAQWHYDRTAIAKLPSAQPKKGKWRKKYYGLPEIVCSECGHESKDKWFFCPCCGADMRGEHDG